MGGEKAELTAAVISAMGSPPRRRGKDGPEAEVYEQHGITPAQAGKRHTGRRCRGLGWDHPRVGGEKGLGSQVTQLSQGSPPRRRGKGWGPVALADDNGITPAQAGKRAFSRALWMVVQDHPRVGGEKGGAWWIIILFLGSPPRRRGKVAVNQCFDQALRITPAWAGKRTRSWRAYGCPWDHPRTGGEKKYPVFDDAYIDGSPPRGRGKVIHHRCAGGCGRITPAWAGKSSGQHNASLVNKDHPRVGGEKCISA